MAAWSAPLAPDWTRHFDGMANHPNVNDEVAILLEQLLAIHADLDFDGDGICEQISASLI